MAVSSSALRRVLLVGKGPPDPGGISSLLAGLVSSRIPGASVELLNLTRPNDHAAGRLSGANVRRTLADAWRLVRAARGVEVVHLHSALVPGTTLARAGFLCFAARLGGARVVLHAHSGGIPVWFATSRRRSAGRLALAGADRVACVSRSASEALATVVGPGRVVVVANGVDTDSFRPGPSTRPRGVPPRVLYAGYLTPRKGVLDLMAASERLRAVGITHELVVAGGTPPEGPQAEAQVRAAAGACGARLLGAQPRVAMPAIYRAADVFCVPSWWEAMPLSVMEAMASGLPVVASAVGEIPCLVEDGVSGILVPPRDPDRLAEALGALLTDRRRLQIMGAAARRAALARCDARVMRRTLGALYAEVAGD
jgi:glycosyltransferase involved in cell wall biosynthesis